MKKNGLSEGLLGCKKAPWVYVIADRCNPRSVLEGDFITLHFSSLDHKCGWRAPIEESARPRGVPAKIEKTRSQIAGSCLHLLASTLAKTHTALTFMFDMPNLLLPN